MTAADLAESKLKAFAIFRHSPMHAGMLILSTFPFISLTFGVCPVGQAMPMSSQVQTQGLSTGYKKCEINSAAVYFLFCSYFAGKAKS